MSVFCKNIFYGVPLFVVNLIIMHLILLVGRIYSHVTYVTWSRD